MEGSAKVYNRSRGVSRRTLIPSRWRATMPTRGAD